jgi:hypothetical protein
MNHIDQYYEQYGEEAGLVYAFTVSQIELIKGMALLGSGRLTDEEHGIVASKLSNLSSHQTEMLTSLLDLTDDEINHAMESASAYIEKVLSPEPLQ